MSNPLNDINEESNSYNNSNIIDHNDISFGDMVSFIEKWNLILDH